MRIAKSLWRRISSDRFDRILGQLACFGAALTVLALGSLQLARLPLSETELFFGVLLVLAVSLLAVNLGMLVRIDGKARDQTNG